MVKSFNLSKSQSVGKQFDTKKVRWKINIEFESCILFLYFDSELTCETEYKRIQSFSGFVEIDTRFEEITYYLKHL